jgi:hypothetical protein
MRAICQAEKLRRPDDLTRRHRFISIYATWMLVQTGATADQVTIASIALGLVGALALALPGTAAGLAGVLFLYLSFLCDQVDGEVARYRRACSLRGVYLDELRHLLIYSVPVFALGFDVARGAESAWPLAIAFTAALVLVLARVEERLPFAVFGARARELLERASHPSVRPERALADGEPESKPASAETSFDSPDRSVAGLAQDERNQDGRVYGLSREEREVLRSIVSGLLRVHGFVAHQVVILFLLAFAVLVDRIGDYRPLGLGLEGLLLLAIAVSGVVSLLSVIASRARGDAFEEEALAAARKAMGS